MSRTQEKIGEVAEASVYRRYAAAANEREAALCCPVEYAADFLSVIPDEVIERDYGCGDPTPYVKPGDTVLDLGSGGGKLCFIAAQVVGAEGRVIGVDCNREMLALARKHAPTVADRIGHANVEFRYGMIQDLRLDLNLLEEELARHPVRSSEDFLRLRRLQGTLRRPVLSCGAADSHSVRGSGVVQLQACYNPRCTRNQGEKLRSYDRFRTSMQCKNGLLLTKAARFPFQPLCVCYTKEFNMNRQTLRRTGNPLASPAEQLLVLQDSRRSRTVPFNDKLAEQGASPLYRKELTTLQINVGKVCNQTCTHCHVDAGPDRRESMSHETAKQVLEFLAKSSVKILDITGGAPEINPHFRMLVQEARKLDKQVIDRCNLTILLANGFTDLPEFLAEHHVNVAASLPCYLEDNCDAQRGSGVFVKSIEAIRRLNQLGYAQPNSSLQLDLVYNPTGLGLPPEQKSLEAAYKSELEVRYGIHFNNLLTITNMPVSRFLDDLLRRGKYEEYMEKLVRSFNPITIDNLMCRSLLSVDWNGFIYDCDFNQMLDLAVTEGDDRVHISQLTDHRLSDQAIWVANHCYGCTAGCGSSCGGSLV